MASHDVRHHQQTIGGPSHLGWVPRGCVRSIRSDGGADENGGAEAGVVDDGHRYECGMRRPAKNCQRAGKYPTLAYLGIKNWSFFVTGHENRGDFDSETLMMTVALLVNSRASHAARTTSFFHFSCACIIKT